MALATREHGTEVTDLLTEEHREIAREIASLLAATDIRSFRDGLEKVAGLLSRHEAAEELAVYPILAQFDLGKAVRTDALKQERAAKFSLNKILRLALVFPRSRRLREMIHRLGDEIARHASFEEQEVFPILRHFTDPRKRQMMGAWVENAEALGPTRPHPHMPQSATALLLAGPILTAIDLCRGALRRNFEGR